MTSSSSTFFLIFPVQEIGGRPGKPATPKGVDYIYCDNERCSAHANLPLGVSDAVYAEGNTCPQCGIGTLQRMRLVNAWNVQVTTHTNVQIGNPGRPYGGFPLQRGDSDKAASWGGEVRGGSHVGALYIAELQRDLLRVAHFSPSRGGPFVGKFDTNVLGAVLDFKRYLVKVLQIPGGAAWADPSTTPIPNVSQLDSKSLGIYFPAHGLANPNEVYRSVNSWTTLLGYPGVKAEGLLVERLRVWSALWEEMNVRGLPQDSAESDALKARIASLTSESKALDSLLHRATDSRRDLGTKIQRHQKQRDAGTLAPSDVEAAETEAEKLAGICNALAPRAQAAVEEAAALDAKLPAPSPAATMPKQLGSLVSPPDRSGSADERFDDLEARSAVYTDAIREHGEALAFVHAILKTGLKRWTQANKVVVTRGTLGDLILPTVKELLDSVVTAAEAAELLGQASVKPGAKKSPELVSIARTAQQRATYWNASETGVLERMKRELALLEQNWSSRGIAMPEWWSDLRDHVDPLPPAMRRYAEAIENVDATTLMDAYLAQLEDVGRVDSGTAYYLRHLAFGGRLGAEYVFRLPMDNEIVDVPDKASVQALVRGVSADIPWPLMRAIFQHEGGMHHTAVFGSPHKYVVFGIDWTGDAVQFNPRKASGWKLSSSRGYGMSQKTLFTAIIELVETNSATLPPSQGNKGIFDLRAGVPAPATSGPPIPFFITSGAYGVEEGARTYRDAYGAPDSAKRDCTYKTRHDCGACVRNLRTGPPKTRIDPKSGKSLPVLGGGMTYFDAAQGDFEPVVSSKGLLNSYRIRDLSRLAELVGSGQYPGLHKPAHLLGAADAVEFPCSWLGAIIRYAGSGMNAFMYPLDRIAAIQKGE